MDRAPANDTWFQNKAARSIHEDQLKKVELFNGRALCNFLNEDTSNHDYSVDKSFSSLFPQLRFLHTY